MTKDGWTARRSVEESLDQARKDPLRPGRREAAAEALWRGHPLWAVFVLGLVGGAEACALRGECFAALGLPKLAFTSFTKAAQAAVGADQVRAITEIADEAAACFRRGEGYWPRGHAHLVTRRPAAGPCIAVGAGDLVVGAYWRMSRSASSQPVGEAPAKNVSGGSTPVLGTKSYGSDPAEVGVARR